MATREIFSQAVHAELQRPGVRLLFLGATIADGLQLALLQDPQAKDLPAERLAHAPEPEHLVLAADTAPHSLHIIRHPACYVRSDRYRTLVIDAVPMTELSEELASSDVWTDLINQEAEFRAELLAQGLTRAQMIETYAFDPENARLMLRRAPVSPPAELGVIALGVASVEL